MATCERKGDTLVITVDVSEASLKRAAPSSTGKMLLVDTIGQAVGNIRIQGNIMIKNPAYVAEPKAVKGAKAAA